jgi:hypothetical protein
VVTTNAAVKKVKSTTVSSGLIGPKAKIGAQRSSPNTGGDHRAKQRQDEATLKRYEYHGNEVEKGNDREAGMKSGESPQQ